MVVLKVKEEATGKRPSVLSEWYRKQLGRDVAISDIDWVITSISNKNKENRYLIIEEKNVSSSNDLIVGLGQYRSLKEVKDDIVKNSIPIFIVFIINEDISNGVWLFEFESNYDNNNLRQVGDNWYVDVKKASRFVSADELKLLLLTRVGSDYK